MFNGNDVGSGRRSLARLASKSVKAAKGRSSGPGKSSTSGSRGQRSSSARKAVRSRSSGDRSARPVEQELESRLSSAARVQPGRNGETSMLPILVNEDAAAAGGGVPTAVAAWMRDAAEVPLLTREQEEELARRVGEGDAGAREHMIRANLRLVVKIARDYEHLGLPLLDLFSEGAIGLMKAVDRFDPRKGGKLSTYGSWWIKQQIRRAIANQSRTIRLPVHVEARIYRLGLTEARLRATLGREATSEEIASEMGLNQRRVARLQEASVRAASLDAPAGGESETTIGELVGDDRSVSPSESYQRKADHGAVAALLDRLPAREAEILRARFGLDGEEGRTLEDLGIKLNLTRERIRQLQNEALAKLRSLLEASENAPLAA
jgi:RNA polymerase primary sigma factor